MKRLAASTLALVVRAKGLAKPARFHTHQRIEPGIEGVGSVEDLEPDDVFLEEAAAPGQGLTHEEREEALQLGRVQEGRRSHHASESRADFDWRDRLDWRRCGSGHRRSPDCPRREVCVIMPPGQGHGNRP